MNYTENLTYYVTSFISELYQNGVTDIVISPGSRSTPLALTATEHPELKEWVVIDERSAAFFALGMAKQSKRPVTLICSSGTATANYFPAIIEARYSRVPLIILTADRPHELRDVGAPQAIDQVKLYGEHVKWFEEMALPEASPSMLAYARSKASRAVYMAQEGNAGAVHLNFPFREPLVPDFSLEGVWEKKNTSPFHETIPGNNRLHEEQLNLLLEKLQSKENGIFVCGPQVDEELGDAITQLAEKWNVPILADPLSQIRAGNHEKDLIIEGYDAFLRNQSIREQLIPDFVIRFGAMPVSKAYLFYIKENEEVPQFIVEDHIGYREPAGNQTEIIVANSTQFCRDLSTFSHTIHGNQKWVEQWISYNQIAKKHLLQRSQSEITEGEAVRGLMDVIPDKSSLYVGNSMAIRDLDTFFMTTDKKLTILGNRGANGIDGMISSGVGAAAASDQAVTLLLGDLSFFHDMNGLLAAKHYGINITIVLINNNGGGIFSFLPQATSTKHFEALFGTPLDIDFQQAINMYGGEYRLAKTEGQLKEELAESYQHNGFSVIEVKTDRETNRKWHQEKWQAIEQEILTK
ncbi:2-succinyl-5-enolpyruvyl-6-hydroxy-3-cyclohexene-1-carboxylic-acid synthase [Oceanobacillus halotolerans]|uniref:2-succinyl-5-enolpyruvyl-6-hydroxy-3- cyclohexene-1-carboxylic-acid synthase n=1 Tax=Oceanobacillus halotolerans TaxID=2663380 RepID=UPI0013DD50BE|nr:2-succinyl-5-enolpyruvyl-6-hydroxy-3-cyclohexene-1-carboxylic-acid synthase [Oceanobacillus halotolerans]